jgi:hypothetical protein
MAPHSHVATEKPFRQSVALGLVVLAVSFGILIIFRIHAAGPSPSIQPEAGTKSANIVTGNDVAASGGGYVQFKAAVVGGGGGNGTLARPFIDSSPWNTPLPANATWRDEPGLRTTQSGLGGYWWVNNTAYAIPVTTATSSDPVVAVSVPASWGNPAGPVYLNIAAGMTGAVGGDGELTVISGDYKVCDFWQFSRLSNTTASATAYGCSNVSTGFGPSPGVGAGIRASGASALGGLIRASNLANHTMNQALAVSLDPVLMKYGYRAPAVSEDNNVAYTGTIAMGSRLGIPAGTAMPSGLSPIGVMVWNTLQTYGAYVLDTHLGGSNVNLYSDPLSVTDSDVAPLYHWDYPGGPDLTKILPYVRVMQ